MEEVAAEIALDKGCNWTYSFKFEVLDRRLGLEEGIH
jgi:hypothetical protein